MNLRHHVLLQAAACAERNEAYDPSDVLTWDVADAEVMRGTLTYKNETFLRYDGTTVTLYGGSYRITKEGIAFLQRSVRN